MGTLGYILFFCLFAVLCALYQDHEANKFIKSVNEENFDDFRKPQHQTAATGTLVVAAVLLVISIIIVLFERFNV